MTKNVSNVGWVQPRILPKLALPVSLYKTHTSTCTPGSHDWFNVLSQLRINLHSFAFHPLFGSKILMSDCLHPVSPGYCVPGLYDTCFCGPLCSALTITSRESFLIPHHMSEVGRWAGSQHTRDTSQAHCDVRLTGGEF